MPAALAAVVFLGLVEGDQDGQSPGASREGKADEHGEYNPFVTIPPRGVGVGGTDGITVTCLAKDVGSRMSDDRIVAHQEKRGLLGQERDEKAGQGAGQLERRAACLGEDAPVTGGMARSQGACGAKKVGDGAPAHCENRGAHKNQEAAIGRFCKNRSEGVEQSERVMG